VSGEVAGGCPTRGATTSGATTNGATTNGATTSASRGIRSSSVRAIPAAIFATFAAGCRSSVSRNGTSSAAASATPTVVLPEPETSTRRGFMAAKLPVVNRAITKRIIRRQSQIVLKISPIASGIAACCPPSCGGYSDRDLPTRVAQPHALALRTVLFERNAAGSKHGRGTGN